MAKILLQSESFEAFIARGGKVTKCATHGSKRGPRVKKEPVEQEPVDLSALPAALKIKFGIKA
jgi:hypothetical protein